MGRLGAKLRNLSLFLLSFFFFFVNFLKKGLMGLRGLGLSGSRACRA